MVPVLVFVQNLSGESKFQTRSLFFAYIMSALSVDYIPTFQVPPAPRSRMTGRQVIKMVAAAAAAAAAAPPKVLKLVSGRTTETTSVWDTDRMKPRVEISLGGQLSILEGWRDAVVKSVGSGACCSASYEMLGKLLNLPVPRFPHL